MRLFFHTCKLLPSFGTLAAVLSVLGLAALGFVAGAAVMYFKAPSSEFLRKAFAGSRSWWEASDSTTVKNPNGDLSRAEVTIDKPEATCDGFTLLTINQSPEAVLIDMRGRAVHRWMMPSARPWDRAAEVRDPQPGEPIHWERCHLFPNGDLLALCCKNFAPYGYGLAKLDKDSQLLWGHSGNLHHDFDVGEDGRIYALADRIAIEEKDAPESSSEGSCTDDLVIFSPDGKELERISILEAFRDSPYFLNLPSTTPSHPSVTQKYTGPGVSTLLDLLHTNSVEVLSRKRAKQFPLFGPGQVLLSLRSANTIAVLDVQKRSIVWAAKGAWQAQHDAQFLDNGKLLLFDNLGGPHGARAIEYDPLTQAVAWWWGGEKTAPFNCDSRGRTQRLANGNTLVVDSVGRNVFEVTVGKDVVWQWHCPLLTDDEKGSFLNVSGANRYHPEELTFLKENLHAWAR